MRPVQPIRTVAAFLGILVSVTVTIPASSAEQPATKRPERVTKKQDLERSQQELEALLSKLRYDESHNAGSKTLQKDRAAIEKLIRTIHFTQG